MTSINFENLVKIGHIKNEVFDMSEFLGLINSAKNRLKDAYSSSLSPESQFDLAYNAAHALALAALRCKNYRANNRYVVFQVLPDTVGVGPEIWRVLAKCHDKRNLAEYEGYFEIEENLLRELLSATSTLLERVLDLTK